MTVPADFDSLLPPHIDEETTRIFLETHFHATPDAVPFLVWRQHPTGKKQSYWQADQIAGRAALWADLDFAHSEAHMYSHLPPDEASALRVIEAMPLPPIRVTRTGHNLQEWSTLPDLSQFADEAEHERAKALTEAWHTTHCAAARDVGNAVGVTADLSRVLRVPGTIMWKVARRRVPVRLLICEPVRRYLVAAFEACTVFLRASRHTDE
jgi:hypothetical protein